MTTYSPKKIVFKELVKIDYWSVKVYFVSKDGQFDYPDFYQQVLHQLPEWLQQKNSFNALHEQVAFLLLHPATEGIFSIINWWVGSNMLNSHVFISDPSQSPIFQKISGDGLGPCVWELEVINHERLSWIKHFLKPSPPDINAYLADTINTEV